MSLPRALLGCAPFVPAGMLFVGRSVVCVRALRGGRGWRFGMLTDCGCAAVFDGTAGMLFVGQRRVRVCGVEAVGGAVGC